MILGTCNFGFDYNGPQIPKKEVFKILEEFQKLGGGIIDTAVNYRESQKIINEYVKINGQKNLNIQTKVYDYNNDFEKLDELKDCRIYSILYRNYLNQSIIDLLKIYKENGFIQKYGQSIYYPHEIRQDANIIQIPESYLFTDYIITMGLYSNIQIRSLYNIDVKIKRINKKTAFENAVKMKKKFPKIDFILGVDNVKQLKENMRLFQ